MNTREWEGQEKPLQIVEVYGKKNKYHISLDIVGEKHRNFGERNQC